MPYQPSFLWRLWESFQNTSLRFWIGAGLLIGITVFFYRISPYGHKYILRRIRFYAGYYFRHLKYVFRKRITRTSTFAIQSYEGEDTWVAVSPSDASPDKWQRLGPASIIHPHFSFWWSDISKVVEELRRMGWLNKKGGREVTVGIDEIFDHRTKTITRILRIRENVFRSKPLPPAALPVSEPWKDKGYDNPPST